MARASITHSVPTAAAATAGRLGRNDPCACGSGLKYKRCCLLRAASPAPVAAGDAAALVELGHNLFGLGRIDEAVAALRRAVALDPTQVESQTSLGGMLAHLGRMAEAEAVLRRAVGLDARFTPALVNLGGLLKTNGRLSEARDLLASALKVSREDAQTRLTYSDVLYDLGEFEIAAEQYAKLLTQTPGSSTVRAKLALTRLGLEDEAGALETARTAVQLDPNSVDAQIACGYISLHYGHIPEAIACSEAAQQLNGPSFGYMLHGMALVISGNIDAGIAKFQVGFGSNKSQAECLSGLGALLLRMERGEEARQCLTRGLEIAPDDAMLRHQIATLSGEALEVASDDYVARLFDTFADSFDRHLLGRLSYAAPQLVRDAILANTLPARQGQLDVLDLGCGTGLVGVELSSAVRTLVGVDLSEKMLERAQTRNVYTRLVKDNLGSAMQAEPEASYDIVVAADVFVYVGRLDEVMPAVHRVLRPEGHFVFTVELERPDQTDAIQTDAIQTDATTSRGYRLTRTGRFAHTADYLTGLAASTGFESKSMREVKLRSEGFQPTKGLLVVWSRR